MTLFQSFVLGLVEGLAEFLPISSTGHLILVQKLMEIPSSDFLKTFDISIQLGAIAAVCVLYHEELRKEKTLKKLLVAFIPTGIIGFLLFSHIKMLLDKPIVVGLALLLGGVVILLVENWYGGHKDEGNIHGTLAISYPQAIALGFWQVLAMIPGVSRSGAIIIGGLLMKLPRSLVTEFTFLLAVPTMLAATSYSIYKNHEVVTNAFMLTPLLVGFTTAFFVALVVIKFFLQYIRNHSFVVFGVYRIVIGLIVLSVLL